MTKREPDDEDLKLNRADINQRLKRLMTPCPSCRGKGRSRDWMRIGSLWTRECPDCGGTGIKKKETP